MNSPDLEHALLQDALAGDAAAKRQLLTVAVDALRRGLPLSDGLRSFLADGLLLLQCAIEPVEGVPVTPESALTAFGFEPNPRHRKARSEDDVFLHDMAVLAAVHVMQGPAGGLAAVAEALSMSEMSVRRSIKGKTWTGSAETALELAAPLLERARVEVHHNPLSYSQELRDFLLET